MTTPQQGKQDPTRKKRTSPTNATSHSKDKWDKLKILFSVLIPASITLVGWLVSSNMKEAEIQSAEQIAKAGRAAVLFEAIVNRLDVISESLYATKNDEYDLGARLSGMMQLVMLAQSKDPDPPDVYFDMAASLLTEYVRSNIDDRKRPGPGH